MTTSAPPLPDRRCAVCALPLRTVGSCLVTPVVTRWTVHGEALELTAELWCGPCYNATHDRPRRT